MTSLEKILTSQFVRYAFVGVIGTTVHTLGLWFFTEKIHLHPLISSTIGFMLSLLISYYLNSILTFKTKFRLKFFAKYTAVSLVGLCINLLILFLFRDIFHLYYMIGQIVAIFVVPVVNFLLNKYWAFSINNPSIKH